MKPNLTKLIVVVSIIALASSTEVYKKVQLTDPNALCLDGSPSVHYLSQKANDKVLLFFEGGGWCGTPTASGTLQSCYQRSKTTLGSSKQYPAQLNYGSGYLSDDSSNYFKDWTKVFIKYCDGAGHQGFRKEPIQYKGEKLYFRGQANTKGHLQSLQKSIGLLTKADKIAITGCSAGGLATFTWTNYIREVTKAKTVVSIPDSGIFLDLKTITGNYSYRDGLINVIKLANTDAPIPVKECVAAYPQEQYKCMFAQYIQKFITVPLLPIQSLYDAWCIPNILGIRCISGQSIKNCNSTENTMIEVNHVLTYEVLKDISQRPGNGAWAPTCINHCYAAGANYISPNYRIPAHSQFSINQVIKRWMEKQQDPYNYAHIDAGVWPSNSGCSGPTILRNEI